jgi:predicted phosphate transport protein (TIGR00153 family)
MGVGIASLACLHATCAVPRPVGDETMRLTPRNTQFYDMFIAAANNTLNAALVLKELINAPRDQRPQLAQQLRDLEHVGDQTTHDIMRALNTSFITPFDREDIAVLAAGLDDIVDEIEAAGDLTVLYKIDELPQAVHEQAELLEEAARVTSEAMGRLRTLQKLEDYWIRINEIENLADAMYRALLARVFDSGSDVVTMIKIQEVVDQLEKAADAFERVANVVQSIAAKES